MSKQPLNIGFKEVVVVTVTYSNRWDLLQQVLVRLLINIGVSKIIIVDNGSLCEISKKAQEFDSERLLIVSLGRNTGSANGYKIGIQAALEQTTCDYIWLLDDDNLPAEDALKNLISLHQELVKTTPQDRLALLALREDRDILQKVIHKSSSNRVYPRLSSFLGFHILDLPTKFLKFLRLHHTHRGTSSGEKFIQIPYAPYGGLFLHKDVISKIGFPDERFFLYADDTDFTYRITRYSGKIFLIPNSVIYDIDKSWHVKDKGLSVFDRLIKSESDFRIYYSLRNSSYFESRFWLKNRFVYVGNKYIFLFMLFIYACFYNKISRFKLVLKALKDAHAGNLNQNKIFTLA